MCGIAGFARPGGFRREAAERTLRAMTDVITHRGPDDHGAWCDEAAGVALGHRRLSIVDLSPAGHQPMVSPSGRYVIVFNGEIYNHRQLRADLEPLQWRGHSDTETLLALIDRSGVESALKQTIGMFAFALWDRQERALVLARDRLGEKPLYYGWQGTGESGVFLFGSELKSLRVHPSFDAPIDRGAVSLQLRHNYIPSPYSIYSGIKKLEPGCFLRLPLEAGRVDGDVQAYWSLRTVVQQTRGQAVSDAEAVEQLDALLRDSIRQQMVADVPLGAFLSGGIDSSTVVALMQAQSSRPVKTFTIGFNEAGYNEAAHAKAVAQHLGTDHTELYVSPREAMDVIPLLPQLYDEPFSDSSQIPTYLVSKLAREHVTVSLSGDAGDELFAGYNRYFGTDRWWRKVSAVPLWLRKGMGNAAMLPPPAVWARVGSALARATGNEERWLGLHNRIPKLAGVLRSRDVSTLYTHFVSHWNEPADVVIDGYEPPTQVTHPSVALDHHVEQMMAIDTVSYLPDDILVKVDRAAMGVSLETRVPFLDHRVVEFAWRLPFRTKVREGQGKWILRQVLYKYVPQELVDRPKMGFGVPIDSWLRGPLRDWAESLLAEQRLRTEGVFRPEPIRQKWEQHLSGRYNWQYLLWDVLMFQAWFERQSALRS